MRAPKVEGQAKQGGGSQISLGWRWMRENAQVIDCHVYVSRMTLFMSEQSNLGASVPPTEVSWELAVSSLTPLALTSSLPSQPSQASSQQAGHRATCALSLTSRD